MRDRPLIIGHRGGNLGPENTLLTIRRSGEVHIDGVEVDVRLVGGVFVALHDPSLDRTTSGTGTAVEQTYDDISSLDAGGGQRIPTIDEVLTTSGDHDLLVLLDVKAGDDPAAEAETLGSVLADHAQGDRVIASSFSVPLLRQLKLSRPETRVAPIVSLRSNLWLRGGFDEWSAISVLAPALVVNPSLIWRARKAGTPVFVWFGFVEWPWLVRFAARVGATALIVRDISMGLQIRDRS